MDVVNYILGHSNLKIIQNNNSFKMSLDSVLLANFVTLSKKNITIMDIGCGNAPISVLLTLRTKSKIIGVEIQEEIAKQAAKTIKLNNLDQQITILNDDINNIYKEIESDSIDTIVSNPPYFKVSDNSRLNDSTLKSIARHEISLDVDKIMKIAKKLLKNNGNIAIVHRPERLINIIKSMLDNNIQPKKIRYIYPKKNKDANLLLIEGTKNGKEGLKILSPLLVHNEDGSYSDEIKTMLRM